MIKTNKQIGIKVKRIREARGMSQMELAEEVGVSFQQVQKYEKGINRISAERIQQIARALGTPVNTFFEKESVSMVSEPSLEYSPMSQEEAKLLQLFREIDDGKIRDALVHQLRGLVQFLKRKG